MAYWRNRILFTLLAVSLAAPAVAGGYRHNLSADLIGWGLATPNVSYEYAVSNHFSLAGDLSLDARDISKGIILTPRLNYYPLGALRQGMQAQIGAYLPTDGDLLGEVGVGYAYWIDRMHVTPAARVRTDQSYQFRLELGYGWY